MQPLVPAEDNPVSQEGVPQGYEAVSLIEVLNGPNLPPLPPNPLQMPPEGKIHNIILGMPFFELSKMV